MDSCFKPVTEAMTDGTPMTTKGTLKPNGFKLLPMNGADDAPIRAATCLNKRNVSLLLFNIII